MSVQRESERALCERRAAECLDVLDLSRDPRVRASFKALALAWLTLAKKYPSSDAGRSPSKDDPSGSGL
jgi:hypothetical protein